MIDTIRAGIKRKVKPAILKKLVSDLCYETTNKEWSFFAKTKVDQLSELPQTIFIAQHSATGIYVKIIDDYCTQFQASLPRVLHGCNALQLKHDELDKAINKLKSLLSEFSEEDLKDWDVFRLDLVIQIECDVNKVLALLRNTRTKLIRKKSTSYRRETNSFLDSVLIAGKDISMSLYDKVVELNNKTRKTYNLEGQVLRVEVQLKNRNAVKKYISEKGGFYRVPDWMTAYHIFRSIICTLQSDNEICTLGKYSEAGLIACLENMDYILPNGYRSLQWYAKDRSRASISRMRKKVVNYQARSLNWNFANLFPEATPPESIDIVDGRLVKVPKPFKDSSKR